MEKPKGKYGTLKIWGYDEKIGKWENEHCCFESEYQELVDTYPHRYIDYDFYPDHEE